LEEARLLINEGLKKTAGDIDFYIERSYFYKLQGIIDFKNKNYNRAISNFNNALAGVERKMISLTFPLSISIKEKVFCIKTNSMKLYNILKKLIPSLKNMSSSYLK
jgi:hypothetical protein